ncbi:MAG: HupE/UreJ family protein [Planctomycetota bacterium]
MRRLGLSLAFVIVVMTWGGTPCLAHVFQFTNVHVVLKSDETFQVDMTVDVDALALGLPPSLQSATLAARLRELDADQREFAKSNAESTLQKRVRIRFDGAEVVGRTTFPQYTGEVSGEGETATFFGTTARFQGAIPTLAKEFTFGASRTFPVVNLTIDDETTQQSEKYILGASEDSPRFRLHEPAQKRDHLGTAIRYGVLGYEHIVPKGLDHILFVLGLFLLSTKWRPLLWQVTAFTIAHSLTLALAVCGVVSLSSRVVEPLIAASIAYVAIENVVTTNLKPWRPAVVFGFGLLHGMGFASVLRELGLPQGELVTALLMFNVGVEFGQLSVVLLAFLAVGWFRQKEWYRLRITVPASVMIAGVGLYWCVTRAIGIA